MSENKSILILCVDRDNDIGLKTGVKTPIIGRKDNVEAATRLALVEPEESDANAMFGAIRAYDDLSKAANGEEYQMATIVGSEFGGVKADKQLRDQLLDVLARFPSDDVILVTDGFSDEAALPIIQSHVRILSVRRVVVKHSERIEESWAIFSRYLAKLVEDPYYSRWVLGAPGILLLALAFLWYFRPAYVGIVSLIFIGTFFLIKGFSIDKKIEVWIFPNPPNLIRIFTTSVMLILIGLDVYQTYQYLIEILGAPSQWLSLLPQVIGLTMKFATNLLVIASCTFLVGIAIYFYFLRDSRIWWTVVGIVATLWMREVALNSSAIFLSPLLVPTSVILNLIIVIGLGITTTVITILATLKLSKRFEYYFDRIGVDKGEES